MQHFLFNQMHCTITLLKILGIHSRMWLQLIEKLSMILYFIQRDDFGVGDARPVMTELSAMTSRVSMMIAHTKKHVDGSHFVVFYCCHTIHWRLGNHTIAPVKQTWRISVKEPLESIFFKCQNIIYPQKKQIMMTSSTMETFSAILTLCQGKPPVTGGFPRKGKLWGC